MIKKLFKWVVLSLITAEAKAVLRKYQPRIIAITGSVGKTSTKDAIYTALKNSLSVRKSAKSYNSDFGVPLTILDRETFWNNPLGWTLTLLEGVKLLVLNYPFPSWLILEVGADKPGDLRDIMSWVKPDIVVVTRFPDVPVHVEFYESIEALFAEEAAPVFALKTPGVLVLNNDDERVRAFGDGSPHTVYTYGSTPSANVRSFDEAVEYTPDSEGRLIPLGMKFDIIAGDRQATLHARDALGMQHVYPLLAAAAVGLSQNVPLAAIADSLNKEHNTPPGRMKLVRGEKDTFLIDDTYNSSPVAAREALLTLGSLKAYGRKIAVLGDMRELGRYSEEEHKKIGALAAEKADILITVGDEARFMAEGALDAGMKDENIFQYEESRSAGKFLETLIQKGDFVLVKGSQSIRMERIVEEVMAHPEDRVGTLVRQEPQWTQRL